MSKHQVQLAIVFADITGSTKLYDTLGDTIARELVSQCIKLMTEVTLKHGGRLIKTIGDEIMCTFPDSDSAVEATMEMHEAVTEDMSSINPNAPRDMSIRVGFHYGNCIEENNDVFGDAVNVAARMAGLAKAGQIITTEFTANRLSAALKENSRHLDRLPVKGKIGHINIYEVIWQQEDVTRMATGLLKTETSKAKLILDYLGKKVEVSPGHSGALKMGRGKNVDLVVNDTLASREHARIEVRRGKFVLADQSTNGTYVRTPDGDSYLRRDELILTGKGVFSLGRDLKEDPEHVVHYQCEN